MDWTNLHTVKDETGKKFNHVLTVTDLGSKQVILIPCWWKDKAPVVASQFLHEGVRHRGLLSGIVSDRDTKFTKCLLEIFMPSHRSQGKIDFTFPRPSQHCSGENQSDHETSIKDSCHDEAVGADCVATPID